jgi:general secretion pathway protein E
MLFDHGLAFLTHLGNTQQITASDLQICQGLVQEGRAGPVAAVLRLGAMAESEIFLLLQNEWQVEHVKTGDHSEWVIAVREGLVSQGLSNAWCQTNHIAIWTDETGTCCCLASDFLSRSLSELLLQKSSGKPLRFMSMRSDDLARLFAQIQGAGQTQLIHNASVSQLRELAEEGPIIELVNNMLSTAAFRRASDVHIEGRKDGFAARLRIDGQMYPAFTYSRDKYDAVVCRIKILAELDIAERRLPQDGRVQARLNGEEFDIRVSIIPSADGESVVLRLLRNQKQMMSLVDLGMSSIDEANFVSQMRLPNGIVLVTGPTGSGKTTTLYTGIQYLNDGQRKIVTVEDPVEYKIEGITQTQVNAEIGLTFAHVLRSVLRHDPDVILIGEIRDKETAEIAIQAALTGHLVLSTLHTNSALASVIRLADMGIEPYLISASLRSAIAQRLVRRLCVHCSEPDTDPSMLVDQAAKNKLPIADWSLARKASHMGCTKCSQTGYLGRLALYEIVPFTEAMHETLRSSRYAEAQLVEVARGEGAKSLLQDGLMKISMGLTSLEEVLSVC